jgi:hypothetical protein
VIIVGNFLGEWEWIFERWGAVDIGESDSIVAGREISGVYRGGSAI